MDDDDALIDQGIDDFFSSLETLKPATAPRRRRSSYGSGGPLLDTAEDEDGSEAYTTNFDDVGSCIGSSLASTGSKAFNGRDSISSTFRDRASLSPLIPTRIDVALETDKHSMYNLSKAATPSKQRSTMTDNLQKKLSELGFDQSSLSPSSVLADLHSYFPGDSATNNTLNIVEIEGSLFGDPSKRLSSANKGYETSECWLVGSRLLSSEEGSSSKAVASILSPDISSSSTSKLFCDSDSAAAPRTPREAPPDIEYADFVQLLVLPESKNIVDNVRKFIQSVLGPNGDLTPPAKPGAVDYIFYGLSHLPKRCSNFFEDMRKLFAQLPCLRGRSDEFIMSVRDCLERYVMTRIGELAMGSVEVCAEDEALLARMRKLHFLQPEHLDIKPELHNSMLWAIATDELRRVNSYRSPGEKVACVVKCAAVLFNSLNLARAAADEDVADAPGADDFLPIFIYVVLQSGIPRLCSNCEYIQTFHNPERLLSKAGYCFVNLQSAIEFIRCLDADSVVGIEPAEFQRLMDDGLTHSSHARRHYI